jgi:hypothetical protein
VTSWQIKKHILNSYFKNKDFFKILKTYDDLNYLAKFKEQFFSKTHLDASESAKNTLYDVTKVKNLDLKLVMGNANAKVSTSTNIGQAQPA